MPITLHHSQVTPGNAGNAKGNTGNANNATPGNAVQPITSETPKMSRERYKATPERQGRACSSLLTVKVKYI